MNHRTPGQIAQDLAAASENIGVAFVPAGLRAAVDLVVEFAASTAAHLEAAGVTEPSEAPAPEADQAGA